MAPFSSYHNRSIAAMIRALRRSCTTLTEMKPVEMTRLFTLPPHKTPLAVYALIDQLQLKDRQPMMDANQTAAGLWNFQSPRIIRLRRIWDRIPDPINVLRWDQPVNQHSRIRNETEVVELLPLSLNFKFFMARLLWNSIGHSCIQIAILHR